MELVARSVGVVPRRLTDEQPLNATSFKRRQDKPPDRWMSPRYLQMWNNGPCLSELRNR